MRCFYTDPLAAAWMAKWFGVKLTTSSDEDKFLSSHDLAYLPSLSNGMRLYVHKDSLHLLEPLKGDLITFGILDYKNVDCDHYSIILEKWRPPLYLTRQPRIIQRNNISFMWPEREA